MFSLGTAFAENNETTSDVATASDDATEIQESPASDVLGSQDNSTDQLQASQTNESLKSSDNTIRVNVIHHYDEFAQTWDEDGFPLAGAIIKLYDSNNNLISTYETDDDGIVEITDLESKKYYVEAVYADFEPKKIQCFRFH
jgi:cobaltochelatase CobN